VGIHEQEPGHAVLSGTWASLVKVAVTDRTTELVRPVTHRRHTPFPVRSANDRDEDRRGSELIFGSGHDAYMVRSMVVC
jgi:hypothetical protein